MLKGKADNKETAGILLDKINGLLKSRKTSLEQQETAGILIQKIREQLGKDAGIENQEIAGILIDKISILLDQIKKQFIKGKLDNKETAEIK